MSTSPIQLSNNIDLIPRIPEERSDAEKRWVSLQPYLLLKGYELRPRYQPDWVPSWTITSVEPSKCEDYLDVLPLRTLDATRVKDKLQVVIKMVIPSDTDEEGKQELEILRHFSSPPYKDDPANHVVPCLDCFPIPDIERGMFYVMPLLSKYKNPPFYNLSEIHDFLTQIFEGLEFLHGHGVAHCDIAPANIMMDKQPLYDEPYHPFFQHRALDGLRPLQQKYTRSQKRVRYYYIDFGYSKWFKDPSNPRTAIGIHAKEAAPEQIEGVYYDPFKVDIYQLGALLRRDLIPKYEPLRVLLPLARDMTRSNPLKRPTIQTARQTMHTHFAGLSGWRTRWPLIPPEMPFTQKAIFTLSALTSEVARFFRRFFGLLFLQLP